MMILRVEDKEGDGPYRPRDRREYRFRGGGGLHTMPTPHDEPGLRYWYEMVGDRRLGYRFGFVSVEQLIAWFARNKHKQLANQGLRVSVYDSTSYELGDTQCVFIYDEAKFIGVIPWEVVYDLTTASETLAYLETLRTHVLVDDFGGRLIEQFNTV